MSDWDNFNSVFWLSLSAAAFGFFGIALRYCIKSKCSDCSLCFGMIVVKRDTQAELHESECELEHGIRPEPIPQTPRSNLNIDLN